MMDGVLLVLQNRVSDSCVLQSYTYLLTYLLTYFLVIMVELPLTP